MVKLYTSLVILATLGYCYSQSPYCKPDLCPENKTHVTCDDGKFAASCPIDRNMVNLLPHQTQIVHIHNFWRNRIAGGLETKYKPATRMATMTWDPELAEVAAFNVKQCALKYDECRNTATYEKSGQNIAVMGYGGAKTDKTNEEIIKTLVKKWWLQNEVFTMAGATSFPASSPAGHIGHIGLFIRDKNDRIGCAAARYFDAATKRNFFSLACNYACNNVVGKPVYAAGAKASECTNGTHPHYTNLCSLKEVYDYSLDS